MNSYSKKSGSLDVSAWETPRLLNPEEPAPAVSGKDVAARQAAYEEAFREGYENGRELGLQEARDRLQLLQQLVSALQKPLDDQTQEITDSLVELAGRIARAVVCHELNTDPQVLLAMVRQSVAALGISNREVYVHLNPRNAQVLRELISDQGIKVNWHLVDDPHVSLEDFKVRSQDSVVDADIDDRVNLIINKLFEETAEKKIA